MKKKKNIIQSQEILVDPAVTRRKKVFRRRIAYGTILAVVLIAAIVLQNISSSVKESSGISVEEKVVSDTASAGSISKILNSYGTLASADEENIDVPGNIRVTEYFVSEGDMVKEGDKIATIDRTTVLAAIADIQEMISELDAEVDELMDESTSSLKKAPADGTVVKIYAKSGDSVVDVMYEYGALMLISLDDLLAIQLENNGSLHVGDTVTVTGSDKESHEGKVAGIEKDTVTVTVSLDDFDFEEKVKVKDSSGTKAGSGRLYIYSQQKITGYSGKVSSVKVSEGKEVDSGDSLLKITNRDYGADYQNLLQQRETLVEQSSELMEISRTGYVYAASDGVISQVNEDLVSQVSADNQASSAGLITRSSRIFLTGASSHVVTLTTYTEDDNSQGSEKDTDGKSESTESEEESESEETVESAESEETSGSTEASDSAESSDSDETESDGKSGSKSEDSQSDDSGDTVSRTFAMIWMTADGNIKTDGLPESLTVILTGDGKDVEEKTIDAGNEWTVTFNDLPETSGDEAIVYEFRLKEEPDGYSMTTHTTGDTLTLIAQEKTDSSQSPSGESSESGQQGQVPGAQDSKAGVSGQFPGGKSGSAGKIFSGSLPSGGGSSLITKEGATIDDIAEEESTAYTFGETTLCSLVPNDTVSVDISVDELDIRSIVVGAPVTVTLDAFPGQTFDGIISALNPFGTNSGGNTKYTVTVSMPKEENMLLGMNASINLVLEETEDVLLIPEAALTESGGKTYVYTLYDEETDELGGLTEVTTGTADGSSVEVLSGLTEGQICYYRYAGSITYTFTQNIPPDIPPGTDPAAS